MWPGYLSTRINCWATHSTRLRCSAATLCLAVSCNPLNRPSNVRVVSLLASATEIVCALGAGEMLVGRSHECDNPSWVRQLPACSKPAFDVSVASGAIDAEVRRRLHAGEPLYHIDMELIRDLRPDLVITQSHCEVCAVTPAALESGACTIAARQLSLSASTIEEIFGSVLQVGDELGVPERGQALVDRERQRLKAVR